MVQIADSSAALAKQKRNSYQVSKSCSEPFYRQLAEIWGVAALAKVDATEEKFLSGRSVL
jgi:hypothetical protein